MGRAGCQNLLNDDKEGIKKKAKACRYFHLYDDDKAKRQSQKQADVCIFRTMTEIGG